MKPKNLLLKISIFLGLLFFLFLLITLKDYGINWDTINHLPRGQAYLNYFLTGSKDYSNMPKYKLTFQDPSVLYPQTSGRSYYQIEDFTFKYFVNNDGYGHPPLSDILSSTFNIIFFQKLKLINDIDSYHLYGIVLASFLVGIIFYWVSKAYGIVAGFISAFTLSFYPLFFSEAHFNTEKDVPETVYWTFFIFSFWKGITEKKLKWILISGVFFGLALGTKFNILFAIFIIIPWFMFYLFNKKEKLFSRFNLKIIIAGLVATLIGFVIVFVTWPYLWSDPIGRIQNVIHFYKDIGTATGPIDPRFMAPFGTNLYPIIYIITITPVLVLIFAIFGIIFLLKNFKKDKKALAVLSLIWFIVPVIRVVWHGANIYGGIRQIMEYIPGLAILSGIGGSFLINKFRPKSINFKFLYIFLVFLILLIPIFESHPNENVYSNFIIGGLSQAKEKNMPFWGNTFGSPYRLALDWINKNVPKNAKIDLVYELLPNIPVMWVRPDIDFSALNRSGYLQKGEYALTLNYQGTNTRSYYDMYLDKFLNPVYQSKVDGVPVVTIWKNDSSHLKSPWIESVIPKVKVTKTENSLTFDLNNNYKISRLDMSYKENNCSKLKIGYFEISEDNKIWTRLPGVLPDDWAISYLGEEPKNGTFIEPFVGQNVRYVKFNIDPIDACILKNLTSVKFSYLK
jgi:hypothetical protein